MKDKDKSEIKFIDNLQENVSTENGMNLQRYRLTRQILFAIGFIYVVFAGIYIFYTGAEGAEKVWENTYHLIPIATLAIGYHYSKRERKTKK